MSVVCRTCHLHQTSGTTWIHHGGVECRVCDWEQSSEMIQLSHTLFLNCSRLIGSGSLEELLRRHKSFIQVQYIGEFELQNISLGTASLQIEWIFLRHVQRTLWHGHEDLILLPGNKLRIKQILEDKITNQKTD